MPILKKKRPEFRKRAYFSVSSEGLGHSSRALAIAREFNRDEIVIGSYSYAYDRIKAEGLNCFELEQELKLVGERGSFDVGKTIIKNRSWALNFNNLVNEEVRIIQETGASCVVADGRLIPVMAADKLGLPCVVITNQSAFYPFFKENSALVRIFGRSFDWIMKTWLSSTEEIIIPDFPPPYTVCLPNLSHNHKVMKRTCFTGPLVSWDYNEISPVVRKKPENPYVVVSLGGHNYRRPVFDSILEVAKILKDFQFDVFSSFQAEDIPENVNVIGFSKSLAPYIKSADIVITQAGHSTAMELLTLGKPSIIIPDNKQKEQENNADRMREFGVSSVITLDELNAEGLKKEILNIIRNKSFTKNAQKFSEMAIEIKGRKKAAGIIKDYAERLIRY